MSTTRIQDALRKNPSDEPIRVCGWVRTKRESKAFAFLELNDGSCLSNLQVVFDEKHPDYLSVVPRLTTGASVDVAGPLVASPGKNQQLELRVENITILGDCPSSDYPLQKNAILSSS